MDLCLVLDPLLVEPEARFNNFLIREPVPSWCQVISTVEHPLPRRSETRDLPYIKDMLDLACKLSHDLEDPWIGFFNADIKLTPTFWSRIRQREDATDVFLTKRTDLDFAEQDPEDGEKLFDDSTDGMVIRFSVWIELRHTYPDFVLGEPGWGYGTNRWVRKPNQMHTPHPLIRFSPMRICQLRNHECLHVRHRGVWKDTNSPEQERNLRLYARMKT